jgi:multidrug efflux system membrane fusion protein
MSRSTLFLAAFFLAGAPLGTVAAAPYQVTETTVADSKAVFATVESVDVVSARTRIGGTIQGLSVDEGASVFAGDVIAEVSDPKLGLLLTAVDARIASLQAQLKLTELDLERAKSLRKSGAGSQARLDEAQTNMDVVGKNLKAMEAEKNVIRQTLREGRVLAPTTGRVLKVNVTNGVVVMPGEPIAVIAQEAYRLRVLLPERHARYLIAGEKVKVGQRGIKASSETQLREGTVRQVYPQLEGGRVVADVEVSGLGDFFVGERTVVFVPTGELQTIIVPKDYIFNRFGLTFATVQGIGDVVVETGRSRDESVEVLSGLKAGDILALPSAKQ